MKIAIPKCLIAILPVLALLVGTVIAAGWIGFLFGWIVGASESPITNTAAPLIFGLLATVGLAASIRIDWSDKSTVWRAAYVAFGVFVFCTFCSDGLHHGLNARTQPFSTMEELLGDNWKSKLDKAGVASLYQFRWKAHEAGLTQDEFDPFMLDAVKPIVDGSEGDKSGEISRVLSIASQAFSLTSTSHPLHGLTE